MKHRNAYAVAARARKNAGPMVHSAPVRVYALTPGRCVCCGAWLDEGDDAELCVNCEPEYLSADNFDPDWDNTTPACDNCGNLDFSGNDPWHHVPHVADGDKNYCHPCMIRILRVRLVAAEARCEN